MEIQQINAPVNYFSLLGIPLLLIIIIVGIFVWYKKRNK